MRLTREELSLIHLACYKLSISWEDLPKLSDYAKDQLNDLLDRLLVEIKK